MYITALAVLSRAVPEVLPRKIKTDGSVEKISSPLAAIPEISGEFQRLMKTNESGILLTEEVVAKVNILWL